MADTRRVIETLEQLAALKQGTVILDQIGDVMERGSDDWLFGNEPETVILPALVLLDSWERPVRTL